MHMRCKKQQVQKILHVYFGPYFFTVCKKVAGTKDALAYFGRAGTKDALAYFGLLVRKMLLHHHIQNQLRITIFINQSIKH